MWKTIPDYPDFQISNQFGAVRWRDSQLIIQPAKTPSGYLTVRLYREGEPRQTLMVHSLVKKTFHGDPQIVIHHLDGNKENNNADNLEYQFNAQHLSQHNRKEKSKVNAKLLAVMADAEKQKSAYVKMANRHGEDADRAKKERKFQELEHQVRKMNQCFNMADAASTIIHGMKLHLNSQKL